MAKATKQQFTATVAKYGATWEDTSSGRFTSIDVEAPDGMVWKASGTHVLTSSLFSGAGALASIYADHIQRMDYGVEKCEDDECEHCHPVD